MNKKTIAIIIAIVLVIVLIGFVTVGVVGKITQDIIKGEIEENNAKELESVNNPVATINVEGYEEPIVIELYPQVAPNTVKNFIALVNNGFYNGHIVHIVEKDFVIQTGDPEGNGSGGPTYSSIDTSIEKGSDNDKKYSIVGEFTRNGYDNKLKHERGVVAMARSSFTAELVKEGYNSAGSQFYICLNDAPSLNGLYAGFGRVISGMETVDKISEVELAVEKNEETGEETKTSKPKEDVKISSITVDTKGVNYEKPEVQEAFDYSAWYMKKYYGM